ncbi:TonB-dependent receptor [Sphingomonas sp.]|uniref:TonB-dependent receptor n=1 Tax=Sphingomonas sp. TaxID=28214 RepID=UPI001D8AAA32|nr:TonB-dependent receptor [Sphingomonas sp.]MBX9797510.1 TonB-dependent receptor [Sphingomonas sp.]
MIDRRYAVRAALLAGATLFAAPAFAESAPAAPPVPAQADQADRPSAEPDNDIVVVARRREERLLDVPIAVTALQASDIAKLQAIDLSGLQGAVPNVNLVQGRGSTTSANFFIRGVGQPDALQTFDPAVGVYVDGVYLSRIQGALLNLFDVQRVEVLRGPQGTLYGKNTIGGAVNIVSRKPDFNKVVGAAEVNYGAYNQVLLNGYVSAPIITDKLAISLAGTYDRRDGLVTDPLTGRRFNDRNLWAMRGIVHYKPLDGVEFILSGDYTRQRNALQLGYPTAPLLQTSLFPAGARTLVPAEPYGPYNFRASTGMRPGQGQALDHWGVNLTANIDITDRLQLTSITGYRKLDANFFIDIDASQFQLGDVFVGINQKQFSQEIQFKYTSEKLKALLGFYFLNEDVGSNQTAFGNDIFTFLGAPVTFTRPIADFQNTKSYAVFGQVTYDFTPKFSFTAGLRYTYEEKGYSRVTTTQSSFAGLNNLTFRFPDNLPAPFNTQNLATFDALTPTFTLSYKPDRDTLFYASVSRGFKSGGFNGRANSVNDLTLVVGGQPTIVNRFEPETVWTYETGAKAVLAGGLIRLSAAAFYSDYRNFQARVGGGTIGAANTGVFPVINAGRLRIWGIELEAVVKPSRYFTLTGSFGYLDARYLEFNDGRRVPPQPFSCNPTGQAITCRPAFAPPISGRLAGDYVVPLGSNALTFGLEGRFIDKHFLSVDNRPGLTEPGYALGNAYVQLDLAEKKYYFRAGVRNFTDVRYRTDGQEFSSVANIQTVYFGDPRTWTLTAGLRF